MERLIRVLALILLLAGLGAVGYLAYDRYTERYTVERRDDGAAVSQVVRATFENASALKVGTVSGTVQSVAQDTRGLGLLKSDYVSKAPFTVDYFVELSTLDARDFAWDGERRTLTVHVPDVLVARANIDESRKSVARTRGVFVTRNAAEQLNQRSSQAAQRTAQAEANRPERVAQARENGRRALTSLIQAPLRAAGLNDVDVAVVFPSDAPKGNARWDMSRSVGEVLGNGN